MAMMLQPRAVWASPPRTPHYWARGDDAANGAAPNLMGDRDVGPTFFAGGQVFSTGDVAGEPDVDAAWTIRTPGVWEVELVWDAAFGDVVTYGEDQALALSAKVNGATDAAPRSVARCRHDVYLADWRTQVFRLVRRFAQGDRVQVWCAATGAARVGARCVHFRLLQA